MNHIMQYTRKYRQNNIRKSEKGFLPSALFCIAVLVPPIGGLGYFPILFAYFVFMWVVRKDHFSIRVIDRNTSTFFCYSLFFLFSGTLLGLISGLGIRDTINEIVTALLPFIAMYIGNEYADRVDEKWHYRLMMFLLLIQFLFGMGQNVNVPFRTWSFNFYGVASRLRSYVAEDVGRAVGTIGSPNYFGLISVIIGTLCIGRLFEKSTRREWYINLVFSGIAIACVVLSVSKTSVICICCVFLLCVLFSSKFKAASKVMCILLCVLAVLYLVPAFETYSNRMINIRSMSGRTGTWQRMLEEYVFSKPLRGLIGYGNGYATMENLGSYVDSFYVALLINRGYVGAFLYFVVWIRILLRLMKQRANIYREYAICLIMIILLADITAAITDMPVVSIVVYYLVGRYSSLSATYSDKGGSSLHVQ